MHILVNASNFIGWTGGVDLIRNFTVAIASCNIKEPIECTIVVTNPLNNLTLKGRVKVFIQYTLDSIRNKSKFKYGISRSEAKLIKKLFCNLPYPCKVFSYPTMDLNYVTKVTGASIIFPITEPISSKLTTPWVGYILDFQHKYLPHYFSETERNHRDNSFESLINQSKVIISNSQFVLSDIRRFHNVNEKILISLPFAPFLSNNAIRDIQDCRSIYKLDKPYFIICNQFWQHKNHIVALEAFSKLKDLKGFYLVCTGETFDYRNPDFFQDQILRQINDLNIHKSIKLLGLIPKSHQLSLIKDSIAVIQPTLFEGGPGGGSSYEAIALQKPLILSDIQINKEICASQTFFFNPHNSRELCNIMEGIINNQPALSNIDDIQTFSRENQLLMGNFLVNALQTALSNSTTSHETFHNHN